MIWLAKLVLGQVCTIPCVYMYVMYVIGKK